MPLRCILGFHVVSNPYLVTKHGDMQFATCTGCGNHIVRNPGGRWRRPPAGMVVRWRDGIPSIERRERKVRRDR